MPHKNVGPQAHSDTNIPHNVEMIQHLLHLTHKRTIINVSRGKKKANIKRKVVSMWDGFRREQGSTVSWEKGYTVKCNI